VCSCRRGGVKAQGQRRWCRFPKNTGELTAAEVNDMQGCLQEAQQAKQITVPRDAAWDRGQSNAAVIVGAPKAGVDMLSPNRERAV